MFSYLQEVGHWNDDWNRKPRRAIWSAAGLVAGLACAWLSSAATAQSSSPAPISATNSAAPNVATLRVDGRLQGLVRATTTQFQIAYRHNAEEQARRHEKLVEAVAAWRAGARSAANDQLLAEWLHAVIRKSMPGSREPLPELPVFVRPAVTPPAVTATPTMPLSRTWSVTTTLQKPVVEKSAPTQLQAQTAPPAVEQPRAGQEPAAPTAEQQDFWSAHPANKDLPSDLSGGDPFQDDP